MQLITSNFIDAGHLTRPQREGQPMFRNFSPIYAFLLLAVMLLAMRFFFPLFMFLLIALSGGLLVWIVSQSVINRKRRAEERTPAGRIRKKIADIRTKRGKLLDELKDVQKDIEQLRAKVSSGKNVVESTRRDSKELLRGFRQQRDIRMAKLNFYRTSLDRLEGLLSNYELTQAIRKGRKRLRELESGQEESIADFEALSWDIRQDQLYLDTVEELEARLHLSDSPQSAQLIQEELEEMTRELDQRGAPPEEPA